MRIVLRLNLNLYAEVRVRLTAGALTQPLLLLLVEVRRRQIVCDAAVYIAVDVLVHYL